MTENYSLVDHAYRRRFPRRQFKQKVGLLFSANYTIVQGREIGEGGMLLVTREPLEKGRQVVLNFFMAQNRFVTVTGEIVYKVVNKTDHFGIKFINLSFEGKRAIRDFIADIAIMESHEEKVI